MNIYYAEFAMRCPVNNQLIQYSLKIKSVEVIMVEDITKVVNDLPQVGFHEATADYFARLLPGLQTMKAHHHGVDIKTIRGFIE